MATTVGTPTAPLTNVTALRKFVWSEKNQFVDSVSPSVFVALKAETVSNGSGEIVLNKPGIVLDVTNEGVAGQGQSVRLALRTPLKMRAAYGDESEYDFEDESALSYGEVFYNEISKPVKMYDRGYQANDVAWLKYNQGYNALQTQFIQEQDDYFAHQALMFTYAENLTYAPVSKAAALNKNWYIPQLADASQPTWDETAVTVTDGAADSDEWYSSRAYSGAGSFVENLGVALAAGAGVGSTPENYMDTTAWTRLRNYIITNRTVKSIRLDGKDTYVCLVPTQALSWMLNPANTGSIGAYYKDVLQYKSSERDVIPGEVGRIMDCFLIIEDQRGATLTQSGSEGSYSLTPGYLLPGNNDDRNLSAWSNTSGSTNYVHDVMLVLGDKALAKYTRDALEMGITETTRYKKVKGTLAYKGEGWQIPFFDLDSASQSSTTRIYKGSLCVPIGRLAA
jgi:hypothetical protein